MEATPKQLLKHGKENYAFLEAIKEADGDVKPNIFADKLKEALFSITYYGWLVGTYGAKNWKLYVNPKDMICPNCKDLFNRLVALNVTHQCEKCGYVKHLL